MTHTTHDDNGVKRPPIQITILLDEATGQFGISGVPGNRITALGMLDMARHMITSGQIQPERRSPIVRVPPGAVLPKTQQ